MWSSNSKNINSINSKFIPIDKNNENNINEIRPLYQTPIKQSINFKGNNDTPIQFDFRFYFNNLYSSSGHIPRKSIDPSISNSFYHYNKESNILLFKSSLEKSGFKLTPSSEIKNNNFLGNGICNLNNIYGDELNPNEMSKKNLNELFNNAKMDEYNFSYKKDNNNNYYNNYFVNNVNNNLINKNININNNMNNNILSNNINYFEHNKENNNKNNINFINNKIDINIFNEKPENKNQINSNFKENSNINKLYANNNNINNYGNKEEIFNSPIKKNSTKLFECSGSTLTNSSKSSTRKKRLRKNEKQIILLTQFFNEHKHWSKKEIKEISQKTGLKENKVYKWLWDHKNNKSKATKFVVSKKIVP